jgi:lauroyl/myristoyl acyltransferase
MLAVESGAPLYVVGVRRTGRTRYRGGLEAVPVPADGTPRERVTATMTALAAAFERTVATAPEQWWAVFFPIWPDLEAAHA